MIKLILLLISTLVLADDNHINNLNSNNNFFSDLLLKSYRDHSHHSIARCPFKESCSYYFERQVKEKGFLLGLLHFIDRYYYRENKLSLNKYPLYIEDNYKIKYDDQINYTLWDYLDY